MFVGKFNLGEKAIVTDPCYDQATARGGQYYKAGDLSIILDVEPGVWHANVEVERHGGWGERVAVLTVTHRDFISVPGTWEKVAKGLGVDSGQLGVFDLARYPEGETGEFGELDTFYGKACECTCSEEDPRRKAGIVDASENDPSRAMGVCSVSGDGDGSYPCNVKKNKDGKVVEIEVVFISEDRDEDDAYEEDEDDSYDPDEDRSPDSSDGPDRPEF